MIAEFIVRRMCANPTNKKMHFYAAEMIFTDQTVIVTPNIKDNTGPLSAAKAVPFKNMNTAAFVAI